MGKPFCYKGIHSKHDIKKIVRVYRRTKSLSETVKRCNASYDVIYHFLLALGEIIPTTELAKDRWKKMTIGNRGGGRIVSLSIGTLTEIGLNVKECLIGHWSKNVLRLKETTEERGVEKGWFKLHKVGNSSTRICYVPVTVIKNLAGDLYKEELLARWIPVAKGKLTVEIKHKGK